MLNGEMRKSGGRARRAGAPLEDRLRSDAQHGGGAHRHRAPDRRGLGAADPTPQHQARLTAQRILSLGRQNRFGPQRADRERDRRRDRRRPYHLRSGRARLPRAHRGARGRRAGLGVSGSRPGDRGRARVRPQRRRGPLARRAVRRQGHHRHRRHADRVGHADPSRPSHRARCRLRRAHAQGRRRPAGQDRHHRIRQPASRQDAQPARPRAHARRLVERLGRGGRRLHGADRARHPDHRLDHPAGLVLRRVRLSADLRRASPAWRDGGLRLARHARHPGALDRGHRALARRAARRSRPQPIAERLGAAAHRVLPHPRVGAAGADDAAAGRGRRRTSSRARGARVRRSRCRPSSRG